MLQQLREYISVNFAKGDVRFDYIIFREEHQVDKVILLIVLELVEHRNKIRISFAIGIQLLTLSDIFLFSCHNCFNIEILFFHNIIENAFLCVDCFYFFTEKLFFTFLHGDIVYLCLPLREQISRDLVQFVPDSFVFVILFKGVQDLQKIGNHLIFKQLELNFIIDQIVILVLILFVGKINNEVFN